ncbi:hypothetical protein KGY71_07520 [Candidatus Bipolaricaulota bacterium]|nr:hypothetical protein [Candidatus Bipolaricaulota bacterium]
MSSTEKFISRLEEEYRGITNFTADLSLSGLEPPVSIRVLAVTEPRRLRVEYLSPDQMKGQFFLLEEDFLYQYMPGRNLVVKKDLGGADLPVEAASLTPKYLLELVRSDDLEVKLIGTPAELDLPNFSYYDRASDGLSGGLPGSALTGLGPPPRSGYSFESGNLFGEYVVEITPETKDYEFSRQVIQFDPGDLLPRELITYFDEEDRETVYTSVEKVVVNQDLNLEEVTELPEDAEVIED